MGVTESVTNCNCFYVINTGKKNSYHSDSCKGSWLKIWILRCRKTETKQHTGIGRDLLSNIMFVCLAASELFFQTDNWVLRCTAQYHNFWHCQHSVLLMINYLFVLTAHHGKWPINLLWNRKICFVLNKILPWYYINTQCHVWLYCHLHQLEIICLGEFCLFFSCDLVLISLT